MEINEKNFSDVILAALKEQNPVGPVVEDLNLSVPQNHLFDYLYHAETKEFFDGTIKMIWPHVDHNAAYYELSITVSFKINKDLNFTFCTKHLFFALTDGDLQGAFVSGNKEDLERIICEPVPNFNQILDHLDYEQAQKVKRFKDFIKSAFNVAFNFSYREFVSLS